MAAPTKVSSGLVDVSVVSTAFSGYISPGSNLANNATDAVNDIDFPTCVVASDETSPISMSHAAATAQLDVAYGTGNGGRFDSAISDGTWHCFIISNGTTTTRGFSKLLIPTTAPNYPSGYTHYRRVSSWNRISGVLQQVVQSGDEFLIKTPALDVNVINPGTSTVARSISVPSGIIVKAHIIAWLGNANSVSDANLYSPLGGSTTVAPLLGGVSSATGRSQKMTGAASILTNTAQIGTQLTYSDANTQLVVETRGWIDTRGRT
jgi:hypothetical protein